MQKNACSKCFFWQKIK